MSNPTPKFDLLAKKLTELRMFGSRPPSPQWNIVEAIADALLESRAEVESLRAEVASLRPKATGEEAA
jgi:hypothetical protein